MRWCNPFDKLQNYNITAKIWAVAALCTTRAD